jgi:phospholipid-transporting ATPase
MFNKQVIYIFCLQFALCLFGAIYATLWEKANIEKKLSYLEIHHIYKNKWKSYLMWALVRFGSWIIMFTYFIPISLVVTIEGVRVMQGLFMMWDVEMFDQSQNLPANVQSSNLNEELGQVSYIFSDKTGTLTKNQMIFREFSCRDKKYVLNGDIGLSHEEDQSTQDSLDEFFTILALCHSVVVSGSGLYDAQSPDERALVEAAARYGIKYAGKDENNVIKLEHHPGGY